MAKGEELTEEEKNYNKLDWERKIAQLERDKKNAENLSSFEANKAKADLEKQIADLEKQKADLDKQKFESERALENAKENSEIESEAAKVGLEKQIAEAERDTLKAKYPDTEIEAPEGTFTVDENVTIECKIVTYKAMFEIAEQISDEIKTKGKPKRVVICEQSDINALYSYRAYLEQFHILKKQYEEKCEEKISESEEDKSKGEDKTKMAIMPALIAGTSILKSVLGIASFFRTDEEIKGVKVEMDKESLIAEVAKGLELKDITTVYPAFLTTVSGEFLKELSKLKEIADDKIKESAGNEKMVNCLKDLNDQYNKLITTLATVDEKTGISNLEKVLKGKRLESILNNEDTKNKGITYMLYLKIVAAEGNNNIKNRFKFWHDLTHTGGAIITYFLMDKEGDIKASNNYYKLIGPTKFNDEKSEGLSKDSFKRDKKYETS